MQISETSSEGLKRTLKVVVGAAELNERFTTRLGEIKDRVQLKGFRKGKVPEAHLRKMYGKSVMAEVVDEAIKESSSKAIAERKERPALQPDIALPEDQAEIQRIIDGEGDLTYSMSFEVLPDITLADMSGIKLERLVATVEDAAIGETLQSLVERNLSYEADAARGAETGDRVTIDFLGSIDGTPFDGGKGEDAAVVIGQGGFIPGFEDGLVGAKAGDDRVIKATFPADYPAKELAGKEASFEVKVKEVAAPKRPEIDDDFAKGFGAENLADLKAKVSAQIQREYESAARMKLKRELLDELEKAHSFELPPTLVGREFDQIWAQLENSFKSQNRTFADEGKTEDELKAEYRKIAERRVRLGLVLGEIGDKGQVQVSDEELRRALIEQARRYPGQEKMVYEYFQKTPGALSELRAPIFEDKVIDLVLSQVKPIDKTVDAAELKRQVEQVTEGEG
jgi:trigger factor